jgi:hypothetical protein
MTTTTLERPVDDTVNLSTQWYGDKIELSIANSKDTAQLDDNINTLLSRIDDIDNPTKWISIEEFDKRFNNFKRDFLIKRGLK